MPGPRRSWAGGRASPPHTRGSRTRSPPSAGGEYPARSVTRAELDSKHLAELHARAAELGIPGYRKLRREELIAELLARDGGETVADGAEAEEPEAEGSPEAEVEGGEKAEGEEPPAEKKRGREEAVGEPV